jgi:hypothetical protein
MPPRSPIFIWLLLAATVCLDAIVVFWSQNVPGSNRIASLFFGLIFAQLAVVCFWATFSLCRVSTRCIVLALVATVAAASTLKVEPSIGMAQALTLYAVDITILMVTLWLLRAISNRYRKVAAQFSILNLLGVMTLVAVLVVLLRAATDLQQAWAFTSAFIAINNLIAVACLLISRSSWQWVLRLCAALAIGLFLGWSLTLVRRDLAGNLEAMGAIQALVIFTWLELGSILPTAPISPLDAEAAMDC